jgi:hypothetical protein
LRWPLLQVSEQKVQLNFEPRSPISLRHEGMFPSHSRHCRTIPIANNLRSGVKTMGMMTSNGWPLSADDWDSQMLFFSLKAAG